MRRSSSRSHNGAAKAEQSKSATLKSSVTKGKTVAYEAVVKTNAGKNVEVVVDASGNPVKP